MKEKITCSVINDLLPLYVDNAASPDSRALVEEHLEECKFCRAEADKMKSTLVIENNSDRGKIKGMKKRIGTLRLAVATAAFILITAALMIGCIIMCVRYNAHYDGLAEVQMFITIAASIMAFLAALAGWILYFIYTVRVKSSEHENAVKKFKRTAVTVFSVMLVCYAVFAAGAKLMFFGNAANSDNINIRTEFQYSPDSYLGQEWVFHISTKDGKPVNTFSHIQYDENNEVMSLVYYVREIPIKGVFEANSYTAGYSYGSSDDSPPADDFDFRIAIVYKDKVAVYSMRDEGLFKKQEDVKFTLQHTETPDTPHSDAPQEDQTARTAGDITAVYDE